VNRGPGKSGESAAVFSMITRFKGSLEDLVKIVENFKQKMYDFSRLLDFLNDECKEGGDEDMHRRALPPGVKWPEHGNIEFRSCTFRYDPTNPSTEALTDLSLHVSAGVKLGVIGRRGSGKSTFVNLLLSLGDLYDGQILIDGEDIATIQRRCLRKRIGLVPQTPIIFKASIRDNVAPEMPDDDEARPSDERILAMLNDFHLGAMVTAKGGLDAVITSNDLSAGEQQLLCAVRALVTEPRVLILDEATASLDRTSADFVQQTLYEHFDGTVINIAHHMHFVADADLVLCMHNGRIEDYGTPRDLAAKPESMYAQQLAASTMSA